MALLLVLWASRSSNPIACDRKSTLCSLSCFVLFHLRNSWNSFQYLLWFTCVSLNLCASLNKTQKTMTLVIRSIIKMNGVPSVFYEAQMKNAFYSTMFFLKIQRVSRKWTGRYCAYFINFVINARLRWLWRL